MEPEAQNQEGVEERELLYRWLEDKFGWSRDLIESRVGQHEDAHTVEVWRPHCAKLFPNVRTTQARKLLLSFLFFTCKFLSSSLSIPVAMK